MILDPLAADLCERIRRSGGGAFAGRTVAEIRRSGLALAGTWSLDDASLGVVAHISRYDGTTTAAVTEALGLTDDEVERCLVGLRRGGYVRMRERPDGTRLWSALISGRRRTGGEASSALHLLLDDQSSAPAPGAPHDRTVGNGVMVRVYRPDREASHDLLPIVFFVHGGAWVSGTLESYDNICTSVVELVDCLVVSVDYRLAPEHPFPTQIDDTLAALRWTLEHAEEIGGDRTRLAVMGDSAGGNLATVTSRIAARAGWCRPALQVLVYPVLDARMDSPSVIEHASAPLFSAADLAWMYEQYGGPSDDPRVSPLAATDLAGTPPALIIVAGVDPVRDDGVRYAELLQGAGIPASIELFPTMMHGFFALAPALTEASRARELAAHELRRALGVGP